jgi:xylan 1,4-beta-xylosidase
MQYRNPVLPGFHPDPSACRVGSNFYLATSSFHYFPGIPLWTSTDLVEWRLAGHGISDPRQLDLAGTPASQGLFAPTLRFHDGRFHLTCTEVDRLGNFAVSAPAIEGPWSAPVRIPIQGIDPSLFFDEDGSVYLSAGGETEFGMGITLSVIELASGKLLEGPRLITHGSGGIWPEGPHMYKRDGIYYLFLAEGGTEYGHMETVFRSTSPWGPYEACPRNPVLSHRDDASNPIQCAGHGDLVEDEEGNSWLLCLGVRQLGARQAGAQPLHNLGRETFLAPVAWDSSGWPVIGDDGRLSLEMDGPLPVPESFPFPIGAAASASRQAGPRRAWRDGFVGPSLAPEWSFVRERPEGMAGIAPGGGLIVAGRARLSDPAATPAFLGRPQDAFACSFEATLDFDPEDETSEAGITALYDDSCHCEAFVTRRSGSRSLCFRTCVRGLEAESAALRIPERGPLRLGVAADRESYTFSCTPVKSESLAEDESQGDASCGAAILLGSGPTSGLCTEGTAKASFTGVFLGLYCVGGRALFTGASYATSCEASHSASRVDFGEPGLYP